MDLDWAEETVHVVHTLCDYVLMLNGGPVSWNPVVRIPLFSTRLKLNIHMAASEVGKEIQYFRALFRDIGSTQDQPPTSTRTIWLVFHVY